jgi:hypothetical protein
MSDRFAQTRVILARAGTQCFLQRRDGAIKTTEVVIPAKAGIHFASVNNQGIPAFAGMTIRRIWGSRVFAMRNRYTIVCPVV